MTQAPDPTRAAFDEWAYVRDFDITRSNSGGRADGRYASERTQGAWSTWQHCDANFRAPHTAAPVAEQLAFDDWWANVRQAEDAHQAAEEAWIYRGSIAPAADRAVSELSVGESSFEGWIGCHEPDRQDGRRAGYTKQDMRDAYAAGMSDPLVAPPADRAELAEVKRLVREAWMFGAKGFADAEAAIDALVRSTDAPVTPTPQQICDYLTMLDRIQRRLVEDEARALQPTARSTDAPSEPVAWRYVPSKVWKDYVFTDDPEKVKLAREFGCEIDALGVIAAPPAATTSTETPVSTPCAAVDPHAHWITSPDGLSRRNPAPDASPPMVPNSRTMHLSVTAGIDTRTVCGLLQTVAWMQRAPSGETLPVRLMDGVALAAGEQCGFRFRALVYADLAEQRIDQLLARIHTLEHGARTTAVAPTLNRG